MTFKDFIEDAQPPSAWPQIDIDAIALLQYTGGTTGLPKGAMLTHGNLTSAVSIYDVWSANQKAERNTIERVILVLPLFHIYALTVVLLRTLKNGDLISLHQRFDLDAVMRDIEVKRATAFPGVPTMWIAIASLPDLDKRDLSSLAFAGSGGAPLPVEVAKVFERKTRLALKSGWGMTETCSPGTGHPPEGPEKPGSIGLMLPSIEMDVVSLDDPKQVMPVGETGEIRVRGPNVTRGYWNREAETAEAFVGDRFLTGDIGYMDSDGYFYLVDRKKDMIISGGFNVYPQMIEQAIYTHPSVQEVIVIGIPDDYRGEASKAFVTLRAGAEPFTIEDLRASHGQAWEARIASGGRVPKELPRTQRRQASVTNYAINNVRIRNNPNLQQEVAHDRSRYRFHRPHADRQGLSRRAQHTEGATLLGHAIEHAVKRAGIDRGDRGRGDGRRHAAGRHRW